MTVYVLSQGQANEGSTVMAVYATREAAKQWIEILEGPMLRPLWEEHENDVLVWWLDTITFWAIEPFEVQG